MLVELENNHEKEPIKRKDTVKHTTNGDISGPRNLGQIISGGTKLLELKEHGQRETGRAKLHHGRGGELVCYGLTTTFLVVSCFVTGSTS